MVMVEKEVVAPPRAEKAVAKLEDLAGEGPLLVVESSGCQDPPESIFSSTGDLLPEKILLGSRMTTVLGRINASQKTGKRLLMRRSRVTVLQKAGLFIPSNVAFLLREIMTSVICFYKSS